MFELCEKKIKKCLAAKGLGQTQAGYDSLIENSPDGVVSLKSVTAREDGEVVNNPQRLPGSRQVVSCGSGKPFVLTHYLAIIYIYFHPNLPTFPLMR
jgi:hypothetical protein